MRFFEFADYNDIVEQLKIAEQGSWTVIESGNLADFQKSSIFDDTIQKRQQMMPNLQDRIREFIATKSKDPLQQYGSKDKPFGGNGPIGQAFPKMRYTHLNSDLSLFYTMEGRNPTVFKLYGVFSHDDIGIGQPQNIKRQKNFITRLKNA